MQLYIWQVESLKKIWPFLLEYKLVFLILAIVLGAIILTRLLHLAINKYSKLNKRFEQADVTRLKFFRNAVSFVIWLLALAAIIYLIPSLRALAVTLFAGAGILIALVGLAAQQAFANIIGGIFIVIFKPFRVGDLIQIAGHELGVVEDITLRHTVIRNFQGQRMVVPNSIMSSETVTNYTLEDSDFCRWIDVGISYDSDVDLAMKIMAEETAAHPDHKDVRSPQERANGAPEVSVRLVEFADFSVNLRALAWTDNPMNSLNMHSDINRAIKKRFDNEGIEIPFPYRTLVYKKDLPPNAHSNEREEAT